MNKLRYIYQSIQHTYDTILEKNKHFFVKKFPKVYQCKICGKIEAPFLTEYNLIIDDYGWHQIKGRKNWWVCHHCAEHGFLTTEYAKSITSGTREYTWDEWQRYVKKNNSLISVTVRTKYPKIYQKYLNIFDCN